MSPPDTPAEDSPADVTLHRLRRALAQLEGARLCYGEPVTIDGRTIIPVARVRASGGLGFGRGATRSHGLGDAHDPGRDGGGGGGGGTLDASPVGVLTIGPEGTRFEPIPDPEGPARAVKILASAAATLVTAFAGARALRRGGEALAVGRRRRAGLLRRGD